MPWIHVQDNIDSQTHIRINTVTGDDTELVVASKIQRTGRVVFISLKLQRRLQERVPNS
jgi:hypothetical protein